MLEQTRNYLAMSANAFSRSFQKFIAWKKDKDAGMSKRGQVAQVLGLV